MSALAHLTKCVATSMCQFERVLRCELATAHMRSIITVTSVSILCCGLLYGSAMGSYGWIIGQRSLYEQIAQMIYSAIKVPLLIFVTMAVSLPSFFVAHNLCGRRDEFRQSLRAIFLAQASLTILLAAMTPLTLFAYVSFGSLQNGYSLAILFNAGLFGISSVAAQTVLRNSYLRLKLSHPAHTWLIRWWLTVYAFVGIQLAYTLRPYVGSLRAEPSFFRAEPFENAYVRVWELIAGLING